MKSTGNGRAGFGLEPGFGGTQPLGEGVGEQRMMGPTAGEVDAQGSSFGFHRALVEAHAGARVLRREADHGSFFDAVGAHLAHYVGDVGTPVAHADVDADRFVLRGEFRFDESSLLHGDLGERAAADKRVAMLNFFDDGCGSGRPLTTLRRYSGIWSTVSGVPWARSRTACLGIRCFLEAEFADHADDGLHIFDRRAGNDAVAEVEDVAGPSTGGAQNLFDALLEKFDRGEERDGIEIALHCVTVADGAPAFVEGLPPVEADHVGAGRSHGFEQARGFNAEVDDGHAQSLHGADEALGRFEGIVAIVGETERADPAVEDLNDVGAGLHLQAAVLGQHDDELVEEAAPGEGVAIHHLLGVDVIARAAAFDHVAGQRERRAAKADDAEAIAKVGGDFFDGAGDVGQVAGAIGAQGATLAAVRTG